MNSTSTQTGLSQFSAKSPKVIRKVKDKAYGGASLKLFVVAVAWVIVSLIVIAPLAFISSTVVECFVIAVLISWWAVFWKYASNETKLEETFLVLSFLFDDFSGLHTIAKYDIDVKFLEEVFPIINVHTGGLIEFKDHMYGMLIKYIPERVNENETDTHAMKIQEVIDGLAGETALKFIAMSVQNFRKPILDKLLEAMNQKDVPKKIYDYFLSLYNLISKKQKCSIEWEFYLFVALGSFPNQSDAVDAMLSELPGVLESLHDATITTETLVEKIEIVKAYRKMCLPMVI